MTKSELFYLLKKYHIQPKRENGQNFLINDQILAKIVQAANLNAEDQVLEIGPGFGVLTVELAKISKKVVSVELDSKFIPILKKIANVSKNLEIIQQDILKLNINKYFKDLEYKLIANLPYNISSLILHNFLEYKPRPKEIVLLLQKEVAERVCAKPGKMSILSVAVQTLGQPEIIAEVPATAFYPEPEVASAIIKIKTFNNNISPAFFSLVRIGFANRRKTLLNNLVNGLKIERAQAENLLKKCALADNCRAQELSVDKWKDLFDLTSQI